MEPGIDPNEKTEKVGDGTKPNISEADAWGEKLNPVRETETPFTGLSDAGRSQSE
jgi:hypothetical protein